VDGEATADGIARVDAHLGACLRCRQRVTAEQAARFLLRQRAASMSPSAPPGLRTRLVATLQPATRPTLGWAARLAAFGAAAVVILGVSIPLELISPRSTVLFAAQLAIDHMRCFVVELTSTTSHDAAAVREAYAHDYGWDVRVPPSNAEVGVTLVAARRCPFWLGDHAHLLYRSGDQELSFYSTPGDRPSANLEILGHREHIWSANGRTFVLVADNSLPQEQIVRVAAYLERETR
jgi:anti-sigma factor RsiW